jgi:hypothetical protein
VSRSDSATTRAVRASFKEQLADESDKGLVELLTRWTRFLEQLADKDGVRWHIRAIKTEQARRRRKAGATQDPG